VEERRVISPGNELAYGTSEHNRPCVKQCWPAYRPHQSAWNCYIPSKAPWQDPVTRVVMLRCWVWMETASGTGELTGIVGCDMQA